MIAWKVELATSRIMQRFANPPNDAMSTSLLHGARVLMSNLSNRFGKQVSFDGISLQPIAPLSPCTLAISEGEARLAVGGGPLARIRRGTATRPTLAVYRRRSARVRRTQHSLPLVDTGQLRGSLTGGIYHLERQMLPTEIIVGTRVPYAKFLHDGSEVVVNREIRTAIGLRSGVWLKEGTVLRTPARPFLRPTRDEIKEASAAFAARLVELMGR